MLHESPVKVETEIDPRIKLLSYSSLLTLHSCPRKFELYRLKATENELNPEAAINQNVTFAFGHVIGDAIQQLMAGMDEDKVLLNMFLGWHADLMDKNDKQMKSFWLAVIAMQRFKAMRDAGLFDDYEILVYNGKPACELAFNILFPGGFKMRGSVDAVLRHKESGEIVVLEVKTSSAVNLNPTTYQNSSQAIGYSVVLDVIAPEVSSYKVIYLIYMSKQQTYEMLQFSKTYLQRATWIQELLLDIESIKMYAEAGVYPMRGESCTDWGRNCEYLNQCTSNNAYVTIPFNENSVLDEKVYDIELTLMDLLSSQLDKNTAVLDEAEILTADTDIKEVL